MGIDRWLFILRLRLQSLLRRSHVEDDLADEINDHLEKRTQQFIADGMSPDEARFAARRAFGGVEQRKEECRDTRSVGLVEDLVKDLGYAARMMRRSPGFSSVAVLSLAIGIGANAAIFTVFDALLLRPIPVDRPDELRVAHFVIKLGDKVAKSGSLVSFEWAQHVYKDRELFSDALAVSHLDDARLNATGRELDAPGGIQFVTDNYFSMLGIRAQRGRVFSPVAANQAANDAVVVLSDRMWRRAFAADPTIVGTPITINDTPFTVIGVAPAGFFGLSLGRFADMFVPLDSIAAAQPGIVTLAQRRNWMVQIVGRLKPGLNDVAASAQLTNLTESLQPPRSGQPRYQAELLPIETALTGVRLRFMRPLSILMSMVGVLLVIGCANVATLLLSRASARRPELALRRMLGAGRGRLMRQLGTESLLLALIAGGLGILFTSSAAHALVTLLPEVSAPVDLEVGFDWRVLLFTITVSLAAAVLSALLPTLHSVKADVASDLTERRQSASGRGRLSGSFVIAQVALCLTLVIAAGLLTRSLWGLMTVDPGFDPSGLIVAEVNPEARGYDAAKASIYYARILERLKTTPGVTAASVSQMSFLSVGRTTGTIDVPGFTPANDEERWVQVYQVGANFFTTLGISIIEGRDFSEADLADGRVAAFNQTAAKRFFRERSPLNAMLPDAVGDRRVIAVVRDARYNTLREDSVAAMFVPYSSVRPRLRMTFTIRVDDPQRAIPLVAAAIRELDPLVPTQMRTLEALVEKSVGQERLLAAIGAFFAMAALLMVSLGLYGVMAFWVTERTAEIGVRVALGARPAQVLWNVLQRPLRLVVAGSTIGLLIAWGGSRFIASLLFGLSPQDPATIAGAILLMVAIAAIAGYLPARRASRVDPIIALRCE